MQGDIVMSNGSALLNGNSGYSTGLIFFDTINKRTVVGSLDTGTTAALLFRSPTHAIITVGTNTYKIYDTGNSNSTSID